MGITQADDGMGASQLQVLPKRQLIFQVQPSRVSDDAFTRLKFCKRVVKVKTRLILVLVVTVGAHFTLSRLPGLEQGITVSEAN